LRSFAFYGKNYIEYVRITGQKLFQTHNIFWKKLAFALIAHVNDSKNKIFYHNFMYLTQFLKIFTINCTKFKNFFSNFKLLTCAFRAHVSKIHIFFTRDLLLYIKKMILFE
jgi:hypothetical protein